MYKRTRPRSLRKKAVLQPFHASFEKSAPARKALAQSELLAINLNVPIALTKVLGALPRLRSLRSDIVQSLPTFAIAHFDALQTYAQALAHAHGEYLAASKSEKTLSAVAARGFAIRAQLLLDAAALVARGLIDGKRLNRLKGTTGYLNTSADLAVLVRILRERWKEIASRSAIRPEELDEAESIREQILDAYAMRRERPAMLVAAAADRQRAFTLLVRAYEDARRAVVYLRAAAGDADRIAPSLWAGRRGRGARSKKASADADGAQLASSSGEAEHTGGQWRPRESSVSHGRSEPHAANASPAPLLRDADTGTDGNRSVVMHN